MQLSCCKMEARIQVSVFVILTMDEQTLKKHTETTENSQKALKKNIDGSDPFSDSEAPMCWCGLDIGIF